MAFQAFADMELDDEDKIDALMPIRTQTPDYPYGLRICLTHVELAKLGLDDSCSDGDYLDIRAFARVTSVTKSDGGCRVELQIEKMAVENENDEE